MKDLRSLRLGSLISLKPDATFYKNDLHPFVFVVKNRERSDWVDPWYSLHSRSALYVERKGDNLYFVLIEGVIELMTSDNLMKLVQNS